MSLNRFIIKTIIFIFLIFFEIVFSQEKNIASGYAKTITGKELMENLYVYSSDYFQGRETGTVGQKRAVDFLKN